MRRSPLLGALAVTLAGCFGGPAEPMEVQMLAPPMERAQEAAASWDPTARLLAVFGFEAGDGARLPADLQDAFYAPLFTPDPLLGDGLAPAWLFVYESETQGGYHVIVTGDGIAARVATLPGKVQALPPALLGITPEIAQQLDDLRPGWRDPLGRASMLQWNLTMEGVAAWAVGDDAEGGVLDYLFDARTATPLRTPGVEPLLRERHEGGGAALTLQPGDERVTLRLTGRHRELSAHVLPTGPMPGEVDGRLLGPNGTEIALVNGAALAPWPEPGSWTLSFRVGGPAPYQTFDFDLCAPGDAADQACPA